MNKNNNQKLDDEELTIKRHRVTFMDSNEQDTMHHSSNQKEKKSNFEDKKVAAEKSNEVFEEVKKQRKKKINKMTDIDYENEAYDIIKEMRDLYHSDLEDNRNNKPSLRKLEKIDELCSKIMKKNGQEIFLKAGVLNELKVWLEPLPDNSLPNPKIKRSILELLGTLKVSKHNLLVSEIGKIVHFYAKNKRESVEIRKIAHSVIKRWKGRVIAEEIAE